MKTAFMLRFLLVRTVQVKCVAVVLGEGDALPDAADQVGVRDKVPTHDDDRVAVLVGGDGGGLGVETSGDEERPRRPDVVL